MKTVLSGCLLILINLTTLLSHLYAAHENKSLPACPNEKFYIHTDRTHYWQGDTIWFRIHKADRQTHLPYISAYPLHTDIADTSNRIHCSVKILPEEGVYEGYLPIKYDMPNGDYLVRCYSFLTTSRDTLSAAYEHLIHIGEKEIITTSSPTFEKDDFDVTFHPEGGRIIEGLVNKVAFKAINTSGHGIDISGHIISDLNDTLTSFHSQHKGMGSFNLLATAGKKWFAVCKATDSQKEKYVELPTFVKNEVALKITEKENRWYISLQKPFHLPAYPLLLNISSREDTLHTHIWDYSRNQQILRKEDLPTGIIRVLLSTPEGIPLSERCFFNQDQKDLITVTALSDKKHYKKREKIRLPLLLTNPAAEKVKGSFSISVTDNKDVTATTPANLLSAFLLSSELQGYIEEPSYYFTAQTKEKREHLDLVMLTHGWKQSHFQTTLSDTPMALPLTGSIVSGVLTSKPMSTTITLTSFNPFYYDEAVSDKNGHFYFNLPELPEGTQFILQPKNKREPSTRLIIDTCTFPVIKNKFIFPEYRQKQPETINRHFITKAANRQSAGKILKTIDLEGVEVTANKIDTKGKSLYSSPLNNFISADEIEKMAIKNVYDVLAVQPGIMVYGNLIAIRGIPREENMPYILLDDMPYDPKQLDAIPVTDIQRIEIVKGGNAAIFGRDGGNGAILITTKTGKDIDITPLNTEYLKTVTPPGYQIKKEFYSPRYEHGAAGVNDLPDFRTTLYWNGNIRTDEEGILPVEFYAGDEETSYTLCVEGITSDGKLLHYTTTLFCK